MGKDIRDGHGPRDHANPRGLLGDPHDAEPRATRWPVSSTAPDLSEHPSHVFLAMSAALTVFGLINAAAVAGGAWFGRIRWPVLRRAYAVVRD
jgi:hypothetical protein